MPIEASVSIVCNRDEPRNYEQANGILMGLIVITPLAGYVSPDSAVILGLLGGPIFLVAEKQFKKAKWFTDPIGLLPSHTTGGLFGFIMVAFFAQNSFAAASGSPSLPSGFFFGGGAAALQQLGLQIFAIIVVMVSAFVMSTIAVWVISRGMHGILRDYKEEGLVSPEGAEPGQQRKLNV